MFTVTQASSGEPGKLACTGRLDQNGGTILEEALSQVLSKGTRGVLLELSGVNYLSSAGVRSLLVALKKAKLAGGNLALSGVAPEVEQVLQLSGLHSLFHATQGPLAK